MIPGAKAQSTPTGLYCLGQLTRARCRNAPSADCFGGLRRPEPQCFRNCMQFGFDEMACISQGRECRYTEEAGCQVSYCDRFSGIENLEVCLQEAVGCTAQCGSRDCICVPDCDKLDKESCNIPYTDCTWNDAMDSCGVFPLPLPSPPPLSPPPPLPVEVNCTSLESKAECTDYNCTWTPRSQTCGDVFNCTAYDGLPSACSNNTDDKCEYLKDVSLCVLTNSTDDNTSCSQYNDQPVVCYEQELCFWDLQNSLCVDGSGI
jgi:hypothetical protein